MNEDDLKAPYRKLQAVQEKLEEDSLWQLYCDLFKKKYYDVPVVNSTNATQTLVRDIRRKLGVRAVPLLQHYFTMKEDWFLARAYSLETFIKEIQRIGADYSKKNLPHNKGDLTVIVRCVLCKKDFEKRLINNRTDCDYRCPSCELEPYEKSTKESRNVIKFPCFKTLK